MDELKDHAKTDTIQAERAVIGACLESTSAIRAIADILTAEDFYSPQLGETWKIIHTRWRAGQPTDAITMDGVLRSLRGYRSGGTLDLIDAAPVGGAVTWWAEQIVDGSRRRQLLAVAARARQSATEADIGTAIAQTKIELDAIGSASRTRIVAKPLAEVLQGSDEYDWLIPGILERQDRVIFTGGEGVGKSTLVRHIAILAAAGIHPFTLEQVDPVRVLIVDAENTERQWRRASRLTVQHARKTSGVDVAEIIPLACVPRLDITRERDLSAVHDLIDLYEPQIVFIGPLYRLVPRAIQTDDDAAPVLAALDSIRARGAALVMEAHAGHSQSSPGRRDLRPRGSSALLGWPEFGIGLQLDTHYGPYQANPSDWRNRKIDLTRWRGDRDERQWPSSIYPGSYWKWTTEPHRSIHQADGWTSG